MRSTMRSLVGFLTVLVMAIQALPGHAKAPDLEAIGGGKSVTAAEARTLAKEAFLYGYATVDNYNILYNYALNTHSLEYKAPLNRISHARNLASPEDKAIVAPNVDTLYSYVWLDLRAEPMVLSLPAFESNRYVGLQLIDAYTYIIGYVTPRTNGRQGGDFLIAGPDWDGAVPNGIKAVFRSPSQLALAFYRTQIFNSLELPRVHALQDQYRVTPLSGYLGRPAPAMVPALQPVSGLDVRKEPTSLQFFTILNWMLQYMPTLPEDQELRSRLARIGVMPAKNFVEAPGLQSALVDGMRDGLAEMEARTKRIRSSGELFGSRDHLKGDHLTRATAAMIGIYGNAEEEYLGVGYHADAEGKSFDGRSRYRIRFAAAEMPPVDAFWSITVYGSDRLLYDNPLRRYKIGPSMLPGLQRDPDGGISLHVQHDSPGPDRESNWLPVPAGSFGLTFRTYQPRSPIRNGEWRAPPVWLLPPR